MNINSETIDIKAQSESFSHIKLNHLSNHALTIASKIARVIRIKNGTVIKLQDKNIAVSLAEQVLTLDDDELHLLFREFLDEALATQESTEIEQSKISNDSEANTQYYRGVKVQ